MLRESGDLFVRTSSGDAHLGFEFVGLLFIIYVEYSASSPQNVRGNPDAKIVARVMCRTVLCILSAFPFVA